MNLAIKKDNRKEKGKEKKREKGGQRGKKKVSPVLVTLVTRLQNLLVLRAVRT